ncbi:MAG: hypothetical protein U5R06_00295 [candidate division KSB1 bacterium]|nr:hypothetical protein [candidate division KSB1 bacterium]
MKKKFEGLLTKIMGGSSTERELKRLRPLADHINEIYETLAELTEDELKAKTNEFKYRLRMGETLDDILPEAYAVVKEVCRRLVGKKWTVRGEETEWNMVPFDVQIMGAIVLHEGKIAEMATGEGKTLVATMPLYLNALEGKGAHLITVNDYLAQRDCEWMGEIYRYLGLTVSAIHSDQDPEERKKAYQTDISYGTNNEFGFDYLRDNMATDVWSVVQRPLHYAIIDEVDSVLIDEARTPLIISGSVGAPRNVYKELRPTVEHLYKKQKELVSRLLKEGRSLLEQDQEYAALLILRARRGDPKNKELLELLTSEFWIKKLIERIQGQFEVNKEMYKVDQELYYTIDEKSHVVDITEKGRIFLSGGQERNVADKIQTLDDIDKVLSQASERKDAQRFFTQDPFSGYCNGLTFDGKLALLGQDHVKEEELAAVEALDKKLNALSYKAESDGRQQKSNKQSAWHHFFKFPRKMDRVVDGLTEQGKSYLTDGEGLETESVDALEQMLAQIRSIADTESGKSIPKGMQDQRRNVQRIFFEHDKQTGAPVGLREEGKLALLAAKRDADFMQVPLIIQIDEMLQSTEDLASGNQDYFEFTDNGRYVTHIAEKGRISLLGGNPDLYILPDRSQVEERDRMIQQLLDRTLNQTSFDYAERVKAAEQIQQELESIHAHIESTDEASRDEVVKAYYDTDYRDPVTDEQLLKLTGHGKACLRNWSEQTESIIEQLDQDLQEGNDVFEIKNNRIAGLMSKELDSLLGASFQDTASRIDAWNQSNLAAADTPSVVLREQSGCRTGCSRT